MMPNLPKSNVLYRWFAGLVEDTLYTRLGLCDPTLADYLTELLADFIHVDQIFPLHNAQGRPIQQVADMVTDVVDAPGQTAADRRRQIYRHIGDFTLFWTGVYPENLKRLRRPDHKDHLVDYLRQGKQSYAIASELTADESTPPPAELLRRLSDRFEECAYGLSLVRQGWETRDPGGFQGTWKI